MKHLLVILIAALVLFVVVCPLTPTPTAVVNGKAQWLPINLVFMAISCLAAVLTLKPVAFLFNPDKALMFGGGAVLELACVRLC